jgi:hypothetical protein
MTKSSLEINEVLEKVLKIICELDNKYHQDLQIHELYTRLYDLKKKIIREIL